MAERPHVFFTDPGVDTASGVVVVFSVVKVLTAAGAIQNADD